MGKSLGSGGDRGMGTENQRSRSQNDGSKFLLPRQGPSLSHFSSHWEGFVIRVTKPRSEFNRGATGKWTPSNTVGSCLTFLILGADFICLQPHLCRLGLFILLFI